jgi:tetratricopeptide (TPR) repeat protein
MKPLLSLMPIAVWAFGCVVLAQAAPYIPEQDAEILEQLPRSVGGSVARELRDLHEELALEPNNLELATRLARRYIELGRAEADPRYFGYAQAALKTWWDQPEPPVEVLVLRATLRQNRHEFEAALSDLTKALAQDPRNAQAWITRAVILQVQGHYPEALRSCLPLMNLADTLLAIACMSGSASLSGQAGKSYELLLETLQSSQNASLEVRRWALTLLAEIAARRGDLKAAEQHFKAALGLGAQDAYLLAAYADLLLDQGRFEEVEGLLKDAIRIDGLLLRLALAERELGLASFPLHVESLKARFAASRKRGDTVHQGEEAHFTLHLLKQPRAALQLAQANWAVQREPRDARILLEAALAAHDPQAAGPVLEMLKSTAMEDIQLRRLAAKFKESP